MKYAVHERLTQCRKTVFCFLLEKLSSGINILLTHLTIYHNV